MGVAEDWLELADALARPGPGKPEQAYFRRSISTAYYALFHLLIGSAVQGWNGSAAVRAQLERAFEHRQMNQVAKAVASGQWKGWSGLTSLPAELLIVAESFVTLQQVRHEADYNNAKVWTQTEAITQVSAAQNAFAAWRKIKATDVANEYLLSLLVKEKRPSAG